MNKFLLGLIPLAAMVHQVEAQTRQISGRVTDRATGEGLPGATVLVKGTTNGASTNSDGTFTLTAPTEGGTLQISSVGYIAVERAIGSETQINIGLAADNKTLSEVVVTAYGARQDVKDLTGSVAQVKEQAFLTQPVQSFDQALQGRAAGVQINTSGGTLADQSTIRIRGVNSISNSAQPLIVLDGVPLNTITNGNVFNSGNGTRYNPLADINPNDIEKVDILKDASSTAIYGSRASNGVILITTKRGKSGQNRISVNSFFGAQQAARLPELLNGDDFIAIQNEKAANAAAANTARNTNFPSVIARDIDANGDGVPDRTNWLDETFRNGTQQNYQLAFSGGNDMATYYGSADWNDQKGILKANRLRRGSVRLNLDVKPKTWLRGGVSANYSKALNNGVLTDGYLAGATVAAYNSPTNVPVRDASGNYFLTSAGLLGVGPSTAPAYNTSYLLNNYNNAVATLDLNRNDNTTQRVLANTYLTIEPVKGLTLTSRYGIDYFNNFEDQYSDPTLAGLGKSYNGLVQDNDLRRTLWNWATFANYNKTFGENHTIGLTAGIEYQEEAEKQVYTIAGDFADPKFKAILDGLFASQFPGGGTEFKRGFESYYGNASYSFNSKYYATFSFRADADSRFGANNQRGYFPGGSVGWRISQEDFMRSISVINDLKLRASLGRVGNSNGLGAYASRTLVGAGQYADLNGLGITQVGDPNIQWESATKFDVGFDASFLQDRLGVSFDFFNTNNSGLLLAAPVLRTTGVPGASILRNIGDMYNRGVELTLNTVNVRTESGFSWVSQFNGSIIKNRITALSTPNDIVSGVQRAGLGKSIGVYYLPEWVGVNPDNGRAQFRTADNRVKEYDPSLAGTRPQGSTAPLTGWFFADTGEATTAIGTNDFKYTKKSGYPTWFGGFDNTFSYKGLELGVFLQYSGGNMIYNSTRAGLLTNSLNNNLEEIKDRWTAPGQQTDVPRLFLQDNVSTQASTRWLEKGDFLRLRQISLGYNIPQTISSKFGVQSLRVYGLVQNAYVFTGYKGTDPEVNSNRQNSNIAYGIDNRSVPQPRSYTVGINLSL